jgi:hypothetical protein
MQNKNIERLKELAQMGGGNNTFLKQEALKILRELKFKETNSYRREKLVSLENLFLNLFSNKGCSDYGLQQLQSFIYSDLSRYSSWTDEVANCAAGIEKLSSRNRYKL